MSESSEQPQEAPASSSNQNALLAAGPIGIDNQVHADTQRSLQQASLALEVTLTRIVEVRRSLLRLSESLPNPGSLPRFNQHYNDIRPGHDALLLAGDGRNLETRGDASSWNFEVDSAGSRVGPRRDATSITEIPPTVNDSQIVNESTSNPSRPLEPSSLFTPLSFPEIESSGRPFARNTMNVDSGQSDSAATTRGLRVAAREAGARPRNELTTWAEEYENLLDSLTFPPLPSIPTFPRSERIHQQRDTQSSFGPRYRDAQATDRDQRRPLSSQNAMPPLASWRAPDPRRWRLRQNALVSSSAPSAEFPRPSTVTATAGQFREPRPPAMSRFGARNPATTSLTSPESAALPMRMDDLMYHYRQMQEDFRTDNMGSNINIDWSDEDFITWLFPAQRERSVPSTDSQGGIQRAPEYRQRIDAIRQDMDALRQNIDRIRTSTLGDTQTTAPERSAVRRRGWGRLPIFYRLYDYISLVLSTQHV
jgi:hypothetical protein